MKKIILTTFKIFFYNFGIVFLFTIIIELLFGYWFDKNNLGPFMREHRMKNQKIIWEYKGENIKYNYKRNYYGFRGEEVKLNEIKAIIMGGSVIDQRYTPDQYTITELLNKKLKSNEINLKIINGGAAEQGTKAIVSSFDNWFTKLKGFKPEIILIYVGINDVLVENDSLELMTQSHLLNPNKFESMIDNLKSRSFVYDKLRIFKYKYLEEKKNFTKYDGNISKEYIDNFNFINFDSNYKLTENDKNLAKSFIKRIDLIFQKSKKINAVPIFISNIGSTGFTSNITVLNLSLIDHCNLKKYYCIDLAKKLNGKKDFWYDGTHTSKEGSIEIVNIIFPELYKILKSLNY